tara:strand:+ start:12588 stop:12917 length:330 start_codon:yes stop_codon:yes gene_type:complete
MLKSENITYGLTGSSYPVLLNLTVRPTDEPTYSQVKEHFLKVEIGARFKCTDEGYDQAKRNATDSVIRKLYGEFIDLLDDIKMHADAYETREIQILCDNTINQINRGGE